MGAIVGLRSPHEEASPRGILRRCAPWSGWVPVRRLRPPSRVATRTLDRSVSSGDRASRFCVILHAMSGLEFVAELVSALAWPITVVAALVFLRRPVERWMRERPSRINAGPVELEWDSLVSKVQADLDQPGVPDPAALTSSAEAEDRDLYRLARANPPMAI